MHSKLFLWPLPVARVAPAVGRHHVAVATRDLQPSVIDTTVLLTSEAVTVALRPGRVSKLYLALTISGDHVLVEVTDHRSPNSTPAFEDQLKTGQLGAVSLLQALSTSWGVGSEPQAESLTERVWFRIDSHAA